MFYSTLNAEIEASLTFFILSNLHIFNKSNTNFLCWTSSSGINTATEYIMSKQIFLTFQLELLIYSCNIGKIVLQKG